MEISWRWYAAVRVLQEMDDPAPGQDDRFLAENDEYQNRFLAGLAAIDPSLLNQDFASLWIPLILEE